MNRYRRFVFVVLGIELLLFFLCNVMYIIKNNDHSDRIYRVEAARVVQELQEKSISEIELSKYSTIVNVSEFRADIKCNNDYVVEAVKGNLYRIEYKCTEDSYAFVFMNIVIVITFVFTITILIYIGEKILKPFHNMSELSCELAKGNLSVPIREEKSKFFGHFLWGMDMLREKLENSKEKELKFQKDKKTLILSVSHDIKSPLSAIRLYSKALSENLYDTEEKKHEALQGITRNAKEIERYVNEIVTASREDFLTLEVNSDEFYLSEVMNTVEDYYRDKLSVIHTELVIDEMPDCLLKGDKNRIVEVLQNIMENAIKYGDGKLIKIFYDDEEDCRLIYVENIGFNLKGEELPHLFDSFYRGSNSKGIKGNGLGLYICKNLMRKMDGEVFAHIEGDIFRVAVVIRKA